MTWSNFFFFGCHDTRHKTTRSALSTRTDLFDASSNTKSHYSTMPSNSDSQPLDTSSDGEDSGPTARQPPDRDHLDRFPSPGDVMQNQVDDTNNEAQNSGMCSQSITHHKSLNL